MADIRLIFAGGGGAEDSRPLDETFARWLGSAARVLHLPTALVDSASMQRSIAWFRETYTPLGLSRFEAWTDLSGKTTSDLARFDGVYIGGGNTFYLLDQLRKHELITPLLQFIHQGHPVYGGSAGAIILGHDIGPCAHIDPDIVGLADWRGLDAALGWSIWCHYTPEDAPRVKEYLHRPAAGSSAAKVLAVTERGGIIRDGDQLYAAGYDTAIAYTREGSRIIPPGEAI